MLKYIGENETTFSEKFSHSLTIDCDFVTWERIQSWIEQYHSDHIWCCFSNSIYFTEKKYITLFKLTWPEEQKIEWSNTGTIYCPYIPILKNSV